MKKTNILLSLSMMIVVIFNGCSKDETEPITPEANFSVVKLNEHAPCKIQLVNNSTNASSFEWDFGDNTATSNEKNPEHVYQMGGTYTITLEANGEGGKSTKTETLTVNNSPEPLADFSFSIEDEHPPCEVIFTNESVNATTYQWEFGDGETSAEKDVSHIYQSAGTFTVTLRAFKDTVKSVISKTINISDSPDPVSNFSFNILDNQPPCKVAFTNSSINASTYLWDFGDNNTSTLKNVTHTYQHSGTYTVTLKANGDGGSHSSSRTITIPSAASPVASFTYSGAGEYAPCKVTFLNTSLNATSYHWDFGDNATSTQKHTSHTYQQGGTYTVTLKAIGYEEEDIITKTINILDAPSKVRIKTVKIYDLPFNDNSGAGWDPGSGPDLFFQIVNSSSQIIATAEDNYYSDVSPSDLPVGWSFSAPGYCLVPSLYSTYYIELWDNDTGIYYPDDYIGDVSFKMSNYMNGSNAYPEYIMLNQDNISIRLELKWE